MGDVTTEEASELLKITNGIKPHHIIETLEQLATRERELLRIASTESMTPEFREITLWNIAILAAAAEYIKMTPLEHNDT